MKIRCSFMQSKQIKLEVSNRPQKFKKYHKIKYKAQIITLSSKLSGSAIFHTRCTNIQMPQFLTLLKLLKPELKKFKESTAQVKFKMDVPVTRKPKDIRMGRGKGLVMGRTHKSKTGECLFVLYNLLQLQATQVSKKMICKLPATTHINLAEW